MNRSRGVATPIRAAGQPTAVIGYDDSLRFATNTLAFLTKLTVDWRLASAVAGGCNISSQSDGSAGATQFGLTSS
jgi:hypothetical protein